MVFAYIRVSTQIQSYQGQRYEIESWSKRNGISVDCWVEEKVSGTKRLEERTLGRLIRKMKKGDLLICTELSRLGRNMMMVISILNLCHQKGIRIESIKDHFQLSDSIQSKIIAFAFSLTAEIERNLISQRTREALAAKKAEGVVLGRPPGKTAQKRRFEEMADEVHRMMCEKVPYKTIAEHVGVHKNTLYRYLKAEKSRVDSE